jgi:pimeloyl-ACP methyl ester carboxylesterase
MKIKITTILLAIFYCFGSLFAQSQDPGQWIGYWKGTINAGNMQIGLTFHVSQDEGQLTSTLDVPLQGLKEYKVESTVVDGQTLTWTLGFGATFRGVLKDIKQLDGIWKQNGQEIPCVFYQSLFDRKPQTPILPYPYEFKLVDFSHPSGKLKLSGTLTYPKSPENKADWMGENLIQAAAGGLMAIPPKPVEGDETIAPFPIFPAAPALVKINIDTAGIHHQFPVVLLLSGSGPQDRDESLGAHKPFAVWAHALTQSGFAVLRVDDRGVGKSIGDPKFLANTTTESYVSDAMAAIDYLGSLPMIDTTRVYVIGHSEGAAVALMLSKKRRLSGIVSLAGATSTGIETSVYQIQNGWKQNGYDSFTCHHLADAQRKLISLAIEMGNAKNGENPESTIPSDQDKQAFAQAFTKWVKSQDNNLKKAYKVWQSDNTKIAKAYSEKSVETYFAKSYLPLGYNPWTRFFFQYNPATDFLQQKDCDILMIQGGLDMQVNPVPTRNLVKQMEAEGVGITYAEFPNLNHMMQHAISGNVREYFDIEETLAVEVYIKTCSWLLDRARMR